MDGGRPRFEGPRRMSSYQRSKSTIDHQTHTTHSTTTPTPTEANSTSSSSPPPEQSTSRSRIGRPPPIPRRVSQSASPNSNRLEQEQTIRGPALPLPPPPPPPPPPRPIQRPRPRSHTFLDYTISSPPTPPPKPIRPPPLPARVPQPTGPRDWTSNQDHRQPVSNLTQQHLSLLPPPPLPPPAVSPKPVVPSPRRQSLSARILPQLQSLHLPPTPPRPAPKPVIIRTYDSDEEDEEDDQAHLAGIPPVTGLGLAGIRSDQLYRPGPSSLLDQNSTRVEDMPDATFANRRPPFLNPRVTLNIGSQFNAFALRGKYLCTGHHYFKLWDSLTGECISQANSIQDMKITSMEFKGSERNKQRYVWCGTKDGQLFEFDCLERRITDSKSSLHSSNIVGIFRCKAGGMCSLDESSKVQIWTGPSPVRISGQARAQRIVDKTNFSAMLSHQLWTSSGPSASKSSSALSQRTPTIRVYDPDPSQAWTVTPRALTIPETTGVMVGQTTSGAVIPSKQHLVYLSHDTGHVSVWSNLPSVLSAPNTPLPPSAGLIRRPSAILNSKSANSTINFKKLIKLSNHQITAMEGVTKYLWVGFKTGSVHVYETDDGEGDWKVLKVWRAHKEAVTKIVVDPSLLWDDQVGKLHVASTSTDWKIRLWDGTMSVDWLSKEMKKREAEYCTYRPVRALICSWNIDACRPNELTGTKDNLNFLEDVLKSSEHAFKDDQTNHKGGPELIVFGFQEMIDLENKKLTAKTVLLGSRKKGVEKLSDSVSQAYRQWHDRLVSAVRLAMPADDPYVVIHTENMVGLFTCVFAKSSERAKMRDIAVTRVKTGMKGRYGNKGAIIARLVIDDSSICFINCHLAAGHKHVRQRNADLIDILEEKSGFPDPIEPNTTGVYLGGGNGSSISDHEICFIQGDLNYRIEAKREDVIRAISTGESWKMLEFDQLNLEKKNNPAFRLRSFYEPPIRFHPTYKYDRGTHMYDSSEKNRIPAWCDRILYRTFTIEATNGLVEEEETEDKSLKMMNNLTVVETKDYRRYEVNVSDHRPISGCYLVCCKSIVPGLKRNVWDQVKTRWEVYEEDVKIKAMGYYSTI